ncbi:MAG TPA: class I SAM-dependent methyltransferase [Actinomycetota bacterium]|nr:class I SAM-dependent methyltransferase [Actinomycetota bacterium]
MDLHERIRAFWDEDAGTYDRSPAHAASDPGEAMAWRAVLARHLPPPPARVLDVGAGTGAMSLLAAELGHEVTALDLSPAMLERARAKAAALGRPLTVVVGRSEEPPPGPFDAVIERHVLWTLPDPAGALEAWRRAVRPGGRLVLLEALRPGGGREALARVARRLLRTPPDHHAPYPEEVLAVLPLAGARSLRPILQAVAGAGWRRIRVERLREVERARRRAAGPLLGPLEQAPRYAVTASA